PPPAPSPSRCPPPRPRPPPPARRRRREASKRATRDGHDAVQRSSGRFMSTFLGGLSPARFLAEHWQKKPLLVRQAIPGFSGFIDVDGLFRLAGRRDVVSRLVTQRKGKHQLVQGPLRQNPKDLGGGPWSVLVQGMEGLHDDAWPLLGLFEEVLPRA